VSRPPISGATVVAGVCGSPVRHSLSPLLHNAWLEAGGVDGVYVAFAPPADRFAKFVEGLRGGAVRGLNVTLPFKEAALIAADRVSARAQGAAAANLLIFEGDGTIVADNTDGLGLLGAFAAQAPGFDAKAGPVLVLGAGGAARGAAMALAQAGCPQVRLLNRTLSRAEAVAKAISGAKAWRTEDMAGALDGVVAVINATSAGVANDGLLDVPMERAPKSAVAMDMVYTPLVTPFLARARAEGLRTVDGLEMLIRQAVPSFEAFYGVSPDPRADIRSLAIAALEARA
jgi:shikimate dehydrogenase